MNEKALYCSAGRCFALAWLWLALAGCAAVPPEVVEEVRYGPLPRPEGLVADTADLLAAGEEAQLEGWLAEVERESQVRILVVTIGSVQDYPDMPAEEVAFSVEMFGRYGLGDLDMLFLIALEDRSAGVKLGPGYGRAGPPVAGRIMGASVWPRLRRDEHAEAVRRGVQGLALAFAGVEVGP